MKNGRTRRNVPSGRGVGFVKFETKGDKVEGILLDTFTIEDNGKSRDNLVLEVIEITANVYSSGTLIPIQSGDAVCVSMGPQALTGRTKFLIEGKTYCVELIGLGTAKKPGYSPPKKFDFYEVVDEDDGDAPW